MPAQSDENSKRTRVKPIFHWLKQNGGDMWPTRLLQLTEGLRISSSPGRVVSVNFEKEITVPASPQRLAWMIENVSRLVPRDARRWRELRHHVLDNSERDDALRRLKQGEVKGIPRLLILEGPSHADCLIECEQMIVWIEGKRNDWLAPSTTWDVARDQVARDLESAWLLAQGQKKDYCLLIIHEHPLKHHEEQLINGYRAGTWNGGWPHLDEKTRREFSHRIGTLTWSSIVAEWRGM
jgi:hypothetical protein